MRGFYVMTHLHLKSEISNLQSAISLEKPSDSCFDNDMEPSPPDEANRAAWGGGS
jgi:hypothetical protein